MDQLVARIKSANSIILSTHRQCDGDGLGAQLAMNYALQKMGKQVQVINVDPTPKKYRFLSPDKIIHYFELTPQIQMNADLALIFDTNDYRLIEPLYTPLQKAVSHISFIDHHPVLKMGPQPTTESWIDIDAASTGELTYRLIKALGVPLDQNMSRCLYTSITFDTQLYRYIRNSPNSHLIAAELLQHDIHPEEIHRSLFGNQTVQKMAFLAKALGQIEYHGQGKFAVLRLNDADLFHYNLEPDDARDVVDMIMNIESLEAAVLFREDSEDQYKISLRSKGKFPVLQVAENLGGGGHHFAAGAFAHGSYESLKAKVVDEILRHLKESL